MNNRGFSLIELLFVVGIIALLGAILFPVFAQAQDKARRVSCTSNLQQIDVAVMLYSQDSDNLLPYGVDPEDKFTSVWGTVDNGKFWPQAQSLPLMPMLLQPYTSSQQIWHCPSDAGLNKGDASWTGLKSVPSCYNKYGMSYFYHTELALTGQSLDTITAYEPAFPYTEHGPAEIRIMSDAVGHWHGGEDYYDSRYNVLMADGHVTTSTEAVQQANEQWVSVHP